MKRDGAITWSKLPTSGQTESKRWIINILTEIISPFGHADVSENWVEHSALPPQNFVSLYSIWLSRRGPEKVAAGLAKSNGLSPENICESFRQNDFRN